MEKIPQIGFEVKFDENLSIKIQKHLEIEYLL